MTIEEFAQRIGVAFDDKGLLEQALTHRSYLNEDRTYKRGHNERLEFLGDAVLELIVTDYLYTHYNNPEGELTAWRASLVNTDMLARVAQELGVNDILRMSKGEAQDSNSRARHHILANAVEAIIGAIYRDQGYDAARSFILNHIIVHLDEVIENKLYRDPKSYFQEQAQKHRRTTPHYEVLDESGPDHDKNFIVGAYIGNDLIAKGAGRSKQEAQRTAAQAALDTMQWQ